MTVAYRVITTIFFFFATSLAVSASGWSVDRIANGVSVSTNGTIWTKVVVGTDMPSGSWIKTGPRGRVILARGKERIVYRANTLAAISTSTPTGKKTQLTQRAGSILLSVQTTRRKNTSVVTPHLAAVVKGTVFEVSVSQSTSSVRVDKGVVEVSTKGMRKNVEAGSVATTAGASIKVAAAEFSSLAPGKTGVFHLELFKTYTGSTTDGDGTLEGGSFDSGDGSVLGGGGSVLGDGGGALGGSGSIGGGVGGSIGGGA